MKFILHDYVLDYKERLVRLNMLPLMYMLELNDVMFCVKNLKEPTDHFPINDYISFNVKVQA